MKWVLAGLLFCQAFVASPLVAAERLLLSREDVLERALERNLGIRINRIEVKIARDGIEAEKGIFDPELSASFQRSRVVREIFDSSSVSVGGALPTGGTIELGLSSDVDSLDEYDSFGGLNFRQPLLRGFGFANNLAGLRIARHQFELSKWQYKQLLLDTLAATVFAYNDLYEAQASLVSSRRSRDLVEQLVEDSKKRIQFGAIAQLDIVTAEAQLASRSERLLQARNFACRAENRLKQLIFDNAEDALAMEIEMVPYREVQVVGEFPQCLGALLESSPDIRMGDIALEVARLRLRRDRNGELPSLDVIAQYGFSASGDSLNNGFSEVFSSGEESYSVGAAFSFPLLNRRARAQRKFSESRETIAVADLDRIRLAIQLEFHTSFEIMQTNFERVKATQRALDLAEQSLEAEEKKLNAGTSSTFVVLRLQNDLNTAELRRISATAGYNRSVADFNRLRGVLE